jgi:hypothetical protein
MDLRGLFFVALAAGTMAAQVPSLYPFSFDQDRLNGAPDFSFLNHPLTPADRVFVRDGHFYTVGRDLQPNTPDDRRVRFFGVSMAFGACFPEPANDAARVAKRLRRLGINLVRLHHMDSEPDRVGDTAEFNSTLTVGPYPSFNENGVKRLRAFLTALANEGIYVDLNLHVGYTFRPDVDGVPAIPGGMPEQSKPLQAMYPRMIELQKQYAQGLIDRLQLKGDPVLAMVEISNESSVISAWQWGQLETVLVGDYRNVLQGQWNGWLKTKYQTTAALSQAWGASSGDGPNLLAGAWQLEVHYPPAVASMQMVTTDGQATAKVHVAQAGNWVFLKQTGFSMSAGNHYRVTFQARADLPSGSTAAAPVSVMRDDSPWDGYTVSPNSITLTNQWQTYTLLAYAGFDIPVNPPQQPNGGRVMLEVDGVGADTYVRGMTLVRAGVSGVGAGQTLEQGNLTLPGPSDNPTPQRLSDYVAFLTWVDQSYMTTMRDAVRASTDRWAPITGTQICYGGLSIYDSQDGLDFQDNHFYIDHPNFPSDAWDPWDWRIRDQAAADDTWSSFVEMAWAKQQGRPYTVSEYNQPWPNRHGTEIDPSLAAFGAFQDWDAIVHFDYAGARNWDSPIPTAFDLNGDWTKLAVTGQSAWLFRGGVVKPSEAALNVPINVAQRVRGTTNNQSPAAWVESVAGVPKLAALTRGAGLAKDSASPLPDGATAPVGAPYVTDTGELSFDPEQKLFLLNTPRAAGISGNLGVGKVRSAGPVDVKLAATARDFATVIVTSLDGRDITRSGRLLVSAPGYALRSLPSKGEQAPAAGSTLAQGIVNYENDASWWTIDPANSNPTWGTWVGRTPPSGNMSSGYPPTYMSRVECEVTLRTKATGLSVDVLDGAGNVIGTLPQSEVESVEGGYRIHLNGVGQTASPWFVIHATAPAAPSITASVNPVVLMPGSETGQTQISWSAPSYDAVEVRLGGPGGRLVAASGSTGSIKVDGLSAGKSRFSLVDSATQVELAAVEVAVVVKRNRGGDKPRLPLK